MMLGDYFYLFVETVTLKQESVFNHYLSLRRTGRWFYLGVSLLLAITPVWARAILPATVYGVLSNVMIIVGVVMFILINNTVVAKCFSHPLLVKIGRSSFSIYLWHTPIFMLLYMLLRGSVDIVWIIVISALLTLVIAQLSYRYIERVFIKIGRR